MNAGLTPEQIVEEMRSRIRRYMRIVVLLILGLIGCMTLMAVAVGVSHNDPTVTTASGIVFGALMLALVATSWVLVHRLWRCPACDANVYWVVAYNTSAFASLASKTCPKCNAVLFAPQSAKRSLRLTLIIVGVAVVLGLAGLMAVGAVAQRRNAAAHASGPRGP